MPLRKGNIGTLSAGFIFGLIAGIILAVILIQYGWNLNPLKYFSDHFGNEPHQRQVSFYGKHHQSSEEGAQKMARFSPNGSDSAQGQNDNISFEEFLAQYHGELSDSLLIEAYNEQLKNDHITVAADKLLFSRDISIDGYVVPKNNQDSALLDDSYHYGKLNKARVEFWKSPINYVGYKWANQKLVVFGLYDFHILRIKYFSGNYFLFYNTLYYYLEPSDTFRSLVLIHDEELIRELDRI